jgi:formylglycine-generating enzyme required for sulfatase activity
MGGKVWQWTRSHWQPYPYNDLAQREALDAGDEVIRLVRGGSWTRDRGDARYAFRFRLPPVFRSYLFLGFWVVLCSSPV